MYNLSEDLVALLGAQPALVTAYTRAATLDIAQCIIDMIQLNKEQNNIDIGYGTLQIIRDNKDISFKFIPNASLVKVIKAGIDNPKKLVLEKGNMAFLKNADKYYKNYLF